MLLKDVGIDGRHHDVVLAVDDKRALLDLLQIAVAVRRGDHTPFGKSDELGLADLGLRFRFAVQLSRSDPLEPGLARPTGRCLRGGCAVPTWARQAPPAARPCRRSKNRTDRSPSDRAP